MADSRRGGPPRSPRRFTSKEPAMSSGGAAPRAAVSVGSARAAASRKNGARSRGPTTAEGKARAAQNALKHGLRAREVRGAARRGPGRVHDARDGARRRAAAGERPAAHPGATRRARGLAADAGRPARGRAVRGAALPGPRRRARADPGRQWHAIVRDPAALSRRGAGGALARAAHPQGAPGRAGGPGGRGRRGPDDRAEGDARRGCGRGRGAPKSERTRARRPS